MESLMDKKLLVKFSEIISKRLAEVYENQEDDSLDTMKVYESLKKPLIDFKLCGFDGSRLVDIELMSLNEEMHKIYARIAMAFEEILLVKEYNKNPQNTMWSSENSPEIMYDVARDELDINFYELYVICNKIVNEYGNDEVSRVQR